MMIIIQVSCVYILDGLVAIQKWQYNSIFVSGCVWIFVILKYSHDMWHVSLTRRPFAIRSWVDERDHDVTSPSGRVHALVIVRQSSGMHQHVPDLCVRHRAIVAQETTAAALVVDARAVQRNIYRVRGRIVMGPQVRLLRGLVANDEIHQRLRWLPNEEYGFVPKIQYVPHLHAHFALTS